MEKYVGEDGDMKRAICYTKDDKDMHIWFRCEDMMACLSNWCFPDPSYYYNTHFYTGRLRTEYEKEEEKAKKATEKSKSKPEPRNRYNPKFDDKRRYDNRNERRQDQSREEQSKDKYYWERMNQEGLSNMYDDPQGRSMGCGRGAIPKDSRNSEDEYKRPRPLPQRERRRESSRGRYRDDQDYISRDHKRNHFRDSRDN